MQRELALLLCVALDKHPSSAWSSVQYSFGEARSLMADAMYLVFWELHSRSSIPATGTSINADAEYLGVKTVQASVQPRVRSLLRILAVCHQGWTRLRSPFRAG